MANKSDNKSVRWGMCPQQFVPTENTREITPFTSLGQAYFKTMATLITDGLLNRYKNTSF